MKNLILIIITIATSLSLIAQEGQLEVGKKVPALNVAEWLNGEPVVSFVPGMLYLVEFTHLDCAPCRKAIPHLTELQREYAGRLRVVSIYSYYTRDRRMADGYRDDIQALQTRMGDRMAYTVAMDRRDGATNNRWNNNQGFPNAYLVDGQGKLVWKGMGDYAVLAHAVATALAGGNRLRGLQTKHEAFEAAYRRIFKQREALPLAGLLAGIDSLAAGYPDRVADVLRLKLYVYLERDRQAANRFVADVQQQMPEWTFSSRIFNYDAYEGFDLALISENFDRQLHQNERETATIADLMLIKGRLLIRRGKHAQAMPVLDQAEWARLSLGPLHPVLENMIHGAQQTAEFGVVKAYSDEAARYWLENRIAAGQLNSDATQTIRRLFEGQLTPDQHAVLEAHYREVIRKLRETK